MSEKKSREEFNQKLDTFIETTKEQIMNSEFEVGDFLPSELALAERFDLSKNSVRKGLEELVKQGLIVKKSRIGNLVVSNKPYDQVILRLGYYPSIKQEAALSKVIQAFEERYPLIKVQTIAISYDHYQQTVYDFFVNDIIDVVTINYNDFCAFGSVSEELFEPVAAEKTVYPFLEKPFQRKEQYVKPFIYSPIVLCYNQQHFEEANLAVPDSGWQWDDVIQAANQLTEAKNAEKHCGFYFHSLSVNRWPIFLFQNGVSFSRNLDGSVIFDKEKFMNCINLCRELFRKQEMVQNLLSDSDKDAEKLFLEGKVSMIMSSYFSLNQMKEDEIRYDIAPLPYLEDARTLLLMIGMAINKQSTRLEAAKTWVKFMTSDECQEIIRTETLSIPAVKHMAEKTGGEQVYQPPRFKLFRETIPTFRLYDQLGLNFEELLEITNELRLYWSGFISGELLCKRVETKLNQPSDKIQNVR
ncbi:hypothetical protein ABE41_017540 [Fictibacillus arsenicus]|uniref:HTH gntR-type domain-containing protein n=1 Tax=Fictibacillus arsenicus TaxID=255247 RepID=A0A1B1Z8N1_9BACL|nr:extracellular solute-binding protein [Fictibacillus arsenicus]ANX13817.1 hypothetical protein ABE41_017540 [Fictibacillus arsenicus]